MSIWLEEEELDEAWSAAEAGDCSDELWRKLAARCIRQKPPALEEALVVYRRLIERKMRQKTCYAYREVFRLLRRVRALVKRLGRQDEFAEYLEAIRQRYGRGRNFAALLDRLET